MKRFLAALLIFMIVFTGYSEVESAGESPVTVNVDVSKKYQTIEGFGFFGAKDVWWSSRNADHFYDEAWIDHIVNDLGITMWRNELYPNFPIKSSSSVSPQDSNWDEQKPMINALKAKADESKVDIKVILTIWSPPGEFKIASKFNWPGDKDGQGATRGGDHRSTKNGGTMNPEKYNEFADWIIEGLDMYKEEGIDVYGFSFQNEPWFSQSFNSCTYINSWYIDCLNAIVPKIKEKYPDLKIFGSEAMLATEADVNDKNYTKFYTGAMMKDPEALKNIDVFAFHGYSDGVQATAIKMHKTLWESAYNNFSVPANKPLWMTETSGYTENWISDGRKPGALDLGIAILSALKYGKVSAWVWWQGSELGKNANNEFSLMDGTIVKKRYHVSKHFYKYIRPGAIMVNSNASNSDLLSASFVNKDEKTFTTILLNTSTETMNVSLEGSGVPESHTSYLTTGGADNNCTEKGIVAKGEIILPGNSVMTLVADYEAEDDSEPNVKPDRIDLDKKNVTLKVGDTIGINATLMPANADTKITWTSKNPKIATVEGDGLEAVVKAKAKGTTRIVAETDNGKKAACKIKVKSLIKSIKLNKTKLRLRRGKKFKLKLKVKPVGAIKAKDITWRSKNEKVAVVNKKGVVRGKKKGKAIIRVKIKGIKKIFKCRVEVTKK